MKNQPQHFQKKKKKQKKKKATTPYPQFPKKNISTKFSTAKFIKTKKKYTQKKKDILHAIIAQSIECMIPTSVKK